MKKTILLFLILCLSTSLFALEAKVVSVTGKVQVVRDGYWENLKPDSLVRRGDLIQTGFKSEVVVSLVGNNENSSFTISQLSRITIEQLMESSEGDKTIIHLASGSIKSNIKKTGDSRVGYTVRSPIATASVRGTEINVGIGYNSINVETYSGICAVWNTPSDEKDVDTIYVNNSIPTNEGVSVNDIAPDAPVGSFTLFANQSALFVASNVRNAKDSANYGLQNMNGQTSFQSQQECVSSLGASTSSRESLSYRTGNLNVNVQLK